MKEEETAYLCSISPKVLTAVLVYRTTMMELYYSKLTYESIHKYCNCGEHTTTALMWKLVSKLIATYSKKRDKYTSIYSVDRSFGRSLLQIQFSSL